MRDKARRQRIKEGVEQAQAEAAQQFDAERAARYRGFKLEGILEAPLGICITCDRRRTGPVVIGRTANPEMDRDSSVCAVQNLWLAARAENLGVGWVSTIHHDALRAALQIPAAITPIAHLWVGYVSGFHSTPEREQADWLPRLPLEQAVHQGCWQAKSAV